MLNSSRSCRTISITEEFHKKYKQLSPRFSNFTTETLEKAIELSDCNNNSCILPNMELRKVLISSAKIISQKDNIYSRSQRWEQKKFEKINEKRWNQQISELSNCTFTPKLNKMNINKNKQL